MHRPNDPLAALPDPSLARLGPVRPVRVALLRAGDSPRIAGPDETRARRLAATGAALRPIIVHRPTLRVIDGAHRLRAAVLRGLPTIAARYFDGPEHDAFVLAVVTNTAHGLPLTRADRTRAAERILVSHPGWSDRAIAGVAGLAPGTVAAIRRDLATRDLATRDLAAGGRSPAGATARVGLDGRVRPVDAEAGRRRAAAVVERFPQASLREIASRAGISTGTAWDVRERIRRGEDPVPLQARRGTKHTQRPSCTH
jgi:ParB-like chromosome segregation protein Spo0J